MASPFKGEGEKKRAKIFAYSSGRSEWRRVLSSRPI
jgi:hypothetical protein